MILNSLHALSPEDAEGVLAAAVLSLLPTPSAEEEEILPRVQSVVSEADAWVRRTESSADSRGPASFLGDQLSALALRGADKKALKARAGSFGILPNDRYDLIFTERFEKFIAPLGVRKNHVKEAIASADGVQHLLPSHVADHKKFSLYKKRVHVENDPFTLVTMMLRRGSQLTLEVAFRAYQSDVAFSPWSSPLDVLKAFVNFYGIPLRVGNSDPSKFFLYETLPLPIGPAGQELVSFEQTLPEKNETHFLLKPGPLAIEIAVVFAIDISRYERDLIRHGVSASYPGRT